jgi:outer membrane protein OmpA-like peptidoglycan-associated protein
MRSIVVPILALSAACSIAAIGCGPPPPPKELVEARSSFDRASKGLAPKLAPAALDTAKQALQRAERQFLNEEDTPETRALAYVADRKARLADAAAAAEAALQEKLAAEKQFKEMSAAELERAREQIRKDKAALDEERKAREAAEKGRSEAEKAKAELERKYMAAIASLKEMASVKEEARGVVITLNGAVLFASGKSELLTIAKERLNDVHKVLKDQGNPPLRIEGHTDSTGSADLNRKLSLERAESVKAHFVSQGYPADRIKVVGHGPDRPVADNGSPEGRANNRRVEIIVNPKD